MQGEQLARHTRRITVSNFNTVRASLLLDSCTQRTIRKGQWRCPTRQLCNKTLEYILLAEYFGFGDDKLFGDTERGLDVDAAAAALARSTAFRILFTSCTQMPTARIIASMASILSIDGLATKQNTNCQVRPTRDCVTPVDKPVMAIW